MIDWYTVSIPYPATWLFWGPWLGIGVMFSAAILATGIKHKRKFMPGIWLVGVAAVVVMGPIGPLLFSKQVWREWSR